MNRSKTLLTLLAALVVATAAASPAQAQPTAKKPNILVIWGDDIGGFNISAYNNGMMGYRTPKRSWRRSRAGAGPATCRRPSASPCSTTTAASGPSSRCTSRRSSSSTASRRSPRSTRTDWITTAKHPKTGRLYTEMAYQPMLELLVYLRANGFKTFIVSGGGIEFMRPWAERVYGIPPEQVIGSGIKTKVELQGGKPVLVRLPEISFVDDKAGKPVGIQTHIGRRPIAAFGNSDGDLQMAGRPPAPGAGSACTSTTPTPSASGRATASPRSVASTRASERK